MSNYVVYVIDEARAKPTGRFLAVEETSKKACETMNKWWRAFEEDEKAKPMDYGGVTYAPIADFDEWVSPEEYE